MKVRQARQWMAVREQFGATYCSAVAMTLQSSCLLRLCVVPCRFVGRMHITKDGLEPIVR